jgi:hypothetical protein
MHGLSTLCTWSEDGHRDYDEGRLGRRRLVHAGQVLRWPYAPRGAETSRISLQGHPA